MEQFSTPMMKQYEAIKARFKDCLLFFRMGDFYELFLEDAYIGAKVLNITLTGRPKGKDGRIPMAGVPYHAVDSYLTKLVKAGFKVAICEQVSLPNKYGLVEREVVRVVTPGTLLDEKGLDKKDNNYIISIYLQADTYALAAADLSTGFLATVEKQISHNSQSLKEDLAKLHPSECILSETDYNNPELLKILREEKGLNIYPFLQWDTSSDKVGKILHEHFGVSTLESFGFDKKSASAKSLAALLSYLKQTQKSNVAHLRKITSLDSTEHVVLDRSTIINLEIFSTIREHDTKGTLLNVIDETITPMGARMLKQWLLKPLRDKQTILNRLNAVEHYIDKDSLRDLLRQLLQEIPDLERIISRLSVGLGNARDLTNLSFALDVINKIKANFEEDSPILVNNILEKISPELSTITELITKTIVEEPPIDTKSGGIIRTGVDEKLDQLRKVVGNSKRWVTELEQKERIRTGISSLKVRFNKVFGFYIEISKANLSSVPSDYTRKQTLVNGERYITDDLKKHEVIILSAEEKINQLEYQIFDQTLQKVLSYSEIIQESAEAVATLDCILNFSFISFKNSYVKPTINQTGELKIKNGRHPVVEKLLEEGQFVPNDLLIGGATSPLHLITGPNMAGKSVFIRQIAQIVLLAQIGCFVPAEEAEISIVDRIFVRSGASDVITSGLSTFMVEMVETAFILNHASENSLIVMDEIGRGTSTYDGISIAWAVAEYLVTHFKSPPKTLFATHYHELQKLENQFGKKIKNYSMAVAEQDEQPVFLYTLVEGGASSSFGVAVAKLAGVPLEVIENAEDKLYSLEQNTPQNLEPVDIKQPVTSFKELDIFDRLILKELESLQIHVMTPLEALNKLSEIKQKIQILKSSPLTSEVN